MATSEQLFLVNMSHPWIILKFGGSSVAEPELWQTIADVVEQRLQQGYRPILVLSALKNISNQLEALLHDAVKGHHLETIEAIKNHHLNFAKQLGLSLEGSLAPWFDLLQVTCDKLQQEKVVTPQTHARVVATGELLSSTIGAAFLKSKNIDVTWCDARALLRTSDNVDPWHHFTAAECDYQIDASLNQKLATLNGVLVTQGFIAADQNQQTVLLGREGSDTSAAYFGAKLQAEKIEIWTDVPGVFSSNPREIKSARQIPCLDYSHAYLLAKYGAKVLHPRALAPAQKYQIPLCVKCTKIPQAAGTAITANLEVEQADADNNTCAIATLTDLYCFKYETEESQSQQITNQLLALGFDEIAAFQCDKKQHLLMVYCNSDVEAPSDSAIRQSVQLESLEYHHNLALISLLGFEASEHWITFLNEFIETNINVPIMQLYSDANNPVYSMLIQQNDCHSVTKQLHHALVEKNSMDGLFAENWLDFDINF